MDAGGKKWGKVEYFCGQFHEGSKAATARERSSAESEARHQLLNGGRGFTSHVLLTHRAGGNLGQGPCYRLR